MIHSINRTSQGHAFPLSAVTGCARPVTCQKQLRNNSAKPRQASLDYKTAGVDIDAGNELVRRIKKMNPSIGGFSGMVPFGNAST